MRFMKSPTLILHTPQVETGSDKVMIGVAVLSHVWPHPFNQLSHTILAKAIRSGLDSAVVSYEFGAYYRPLFSVQVLTVPSAGQAQAAIAAIKQTLAALGLGDCSAIATFTAELVWVTIHGLGIGGTSFDKAFLKREEMDVCDAEIQASAVITETMVEAVRKELMERIKTESENE